MVKDVLTLDEVAAYTGLSKSWLYKLSYRNRIPHYKPFGKRIYCRREEIDNWLLQNPVVTEDQLESKASTYVSTHPTSDPNSK